MKDMKKSGKGKGKEEVALLPYPKDVAEYTPTMHVDMPLETVSELKIGQEVVLTIKGCVAMLEGRHYGMEKGCIGIQVSEKNLRKTSNSQAAGIEKLAGEDNEDY